MKTIGKFLLIATALFLFIALGSAAVSAVNTCSWYEVSSTGIVGSPYGESVETGILESGTVYCIGSTNVFSYAIDVDRNLEADTQYYMDGGRTWQWDQPVHHAPDSHSFLQINNQDVDWGAFVNGDPDGHEYMIYYLGKGTPVTLRIYDWIDENVGNNDCHFNVRICRCGDVHTIGYYKKASHWPVDSITFLGKTYTSEQAIAQILKNAKAKDMSDMLQAQLLAAELNALTWTCDVPCDVADAISDAEIFLTDGSKQTGPRGSDRAEAEELKDILDDFNNG